MSKNSRRRQTESRVVETWVFQDETTGKSIVVVRFFKNGAPEISVDPNIKPVQREIAANRFLDVRPDMSHEEAYSMLFRS